MRVCLAQYRSASDVDTNVGRHREVVRRAAAAACDVVLFPELSLTGYRPSVAAEKALSLDAPVLEPLRAASDELGIVVAAGLPLVAETGVEIGLLVYRPEHPPASYAKQLLHQDEVRFFVPGCRVQDIEADGIRIAPAICYEAMQPEHGLAALARGASVYAASTAKTEAGVEQARSYLSDFAARHSVAVLLVNAVGPGDGFISGGRSAAWDASGTLIAELADREGELIVDL